MERLRKSLEFRVGVNLGDWRIRGKKGLDHADTGRLVRRVGQFD